MKSAWLPTIDKPNQKTSQEIYLTVPDQYVTLSNGKLKKQTKNSDGTRTDYWNFKEKHAPYLFFVGIGDFAVIKDRSEEHTSELQSRGHLVCRLLLEKKNKNGSLCSRRT